MKISAKHFGLAVGPQAR